MNYLIGMALYFKYLTGLELRFMGDWLLIVFAEVQILVVATHGEVVW